MFQKTETRVQAGYRYQPSGPSLTPFCHPKIVFCCVPICETLSTYTRDERCNSKPAFSEPLGCVTGVASRGLRTRSGGEGARTQGAAEGLGLQMERLRPCGVARRNFWRFPRSAHAFCTSNPLNTEQRFWNLTLRLKPAESQVQTHQSAPGFVLTPPSFSPAPPSFLSSFSSAHLFPFTLAF